MRHLRTYKLFESDDRRNEIRNRITNRRDQARQSIPDFIKKMSNVINTNYEIYDIDEESIMNTLQSYLTADKGKKEIEYREICGDMSNIDNTGRVVAIILNYGYSIGYFSAGSTSNPDVQFSNLISDIFKSLHFEKVSNNAIPPYDGPVVLSSSITASSFDTKKQIDDIGDMIKRYYNGDSEIGELSVLIGCIYQYGYGLGNDTSYMVTMDEHEKLLTVLNKLKH